MQSNQQPHMMDLEGGGGDSARSDASTDGRLRVQTMLLGWLREAWDARAQSGIEEEWQVAEDLYAGVDPTVSDLAPQQGGRATRGVPARNRSKVVVNIVEGKTNIAASQIIRRVLPGDMKPWLVKPTPVPEYDAAMTGDDGRAPVTLPDGSQHPARDVAKALTLLLEQKAERMGEQIQDWLTDSAVYRGKTAYAELRRMIKAGARLGTGVLKGPVPTVKHARDWKVAAGGVVELQSKTKIIPRVREISVRNCFPDPSCGDNIHDGGYFIERDYLTARKVRELAEQPGYEAEDMAAVLKEGPMSWSRWDERYRTQRTGQTQVQDRATFEVFYVYGEVSPADLIAAGYSIPTLTMAPEGIAGEDAAQYLAERIEHAMQLGSIPLVATMINGRVVKVALNPDDKGGFPYRFFCWSNVEGRPYGKGVPTQIATPQMMLTSSVRAMLENAGQSAGPQIVRFANVRAEDGRLSSERNKHWVVDPSEAIDDVRKAFGLFIVPSVQEQLFNIIKASQEWADQLANIPLLMQGITGASPETMGGMEMLEANAASPLLDITKEYDEVLAPTISGFYDWAMQDPEVSDDAKGDFQCLAIGASVLIHRDRKALALQQVVAPMSNDPGYGLSKERVGEQILRHIEIEPGLVQMTEDERAAMAERPPPVDPRIEAANIKRQTDMEREQSRRENEELERQHKERLAQYNAEAAEAIKQADLQIQVLESARDRDMTAEQIRATLAEAAMKIRDARERFVAERDFAIQYGEGRGL